MAKNTIGEEWRPVVGYEGRYEVSNFGRVRGLRCNRGKRSIPKILRPTLNHKGYPFYGLYDGKSSRSMFGHKIVLRAFVSDRPEGMSCNHKNGVRHDNRLENLEWVTHSENNYHAIHVLGAKRNGLGELNHEAVLKTSDVIRIRARCDSGENHTAVSKEYGICRSTVGQIVRRETWKHIP